MVKQQRVSHALLFLGKEGNGALQLAITFAQYIVCKKVLSGSQEGSLFGDTEGQVGRNEPCGECSSCYKAEKLIHPDIHFSYPVIPKKPGDKPISTDYIAEWREFFSKYPFGNIYDWLQFIGAENKQGNITAEECNDIIRKLSLKSFEGDYKVLLLWMPEYLGNAGNKLLKLIEEPPPNTLIILIAENESLILPTILSRMQLIKVPVPETKEIEIALTTREGVSSTLARQVASVSEGNYREALQLVQNTSEDWQSLFRDWLNAIMKSGPIAQVRWIEETSKLGREKQKQFLRYCNHLIEQSIRWQAIGPDRIFLPDNEKDFVERLNKIAGISQLQSIIEEMDKAVYYIERNANAKMLFHALTIKLYHIIAEKKNVIVY
jgi:DNA polymerase-3 subunit delta'